MSAEQRTNDEGLTMLAQEVARVLKSRNWSLSQAEIQTGVGRGTIHNMQKGLRVRPDHVQRFARAVAPKGEEDATERFYLNLALGLDKHSTEALNDLINNKAGEIAEQEARGEIIRVADPAELELLRFYREVPPDLRGLAGENAINALKGMRTAADIVRERREARTIGKRADREENPTRISETVTGDTGDETG